MKRGELYRVYKGSKTDTKNFRVFVIVSRQVLLDSKFSTAMCAPIYTNYSGLSTQVSVGIDEGLKHVSAIHCDELVSIPKHMLTHFVGSLTSEKLYELNKALFIAVGLD
ncbi:MAG: type II toxin-antitoxin system PemK/MazF family toxin [Spirochaetia bacterium]